MDKRKIFIREVEKESFADFFSSMEASLDHSAADEDFPPNIIVEAFLNDKGSFEDIFEIPETTELIARLISAKAEIGEMQKAYRQIYQFAQSFVEVAREREEQFQNKISKLESSVSKFDNVNQVLLARVGHLKRLNNSAEERAIVSTELVKAAEVLLVEKSNVLKSILAMCQNLVNAEKNGKHPVKKDFVEAMKTIVKIVVE